MTINLTTPLIHLLFSEKTQNGTYECHSMLRIDHLETTSMNKKKNRNRKNVTDRSF